MWPVYPIHKKTGGISRVSTVQAVDNHLTAITAISLPVVCPKRWPQSPATTDCLHLPTTSQRRLTGGEPGEVKRRRKRRACSGWKRNHRTCPWPWTYHDRKWLGSVSSLVSLNFMQVCNTFSRIPSVQS
ncbi:hypothetical protein AKJ16_DCAP17480 [Drosera capensis]